MEEEKEVTPSLQGIAREVGGKTRRFSVLEGIGKLNFKKKGMVHSVLWI